MKRRKTLTRDCCIVAPKATAFLVHRLGSSRCKRDLRENYEEDHEWHE